MSAPAAICDWLATLPLFGGEVPDIEIYSQGVGADLYRLAWADMRAVLKHYKSTTNPTRKGADKRRAEAAALTLYALQGLAPDLLWEGEMPVYGQGDAIIYRWVGGKRASDITLTHEQLDLIATSLRTVHSNTSDLKLLSPAPRTLEVWWGRTHELYRDMQMRLAAHMPVEVSDTLSRLLQPVSGDVQAHKRFWQGAPLTFVHGRPEPTNIILNENCVILKNWQDFGLGDPSHEVAVASRLLAEQMGEDPAEHLIDNYLTGTEDNILARRIEIYRRVWPFGSLLSTVSTYLDQVNGLSMTPEQFKSTAFHFHHLLVTYEWPTPTADRVVAVLDAWLSGELKESTVNTKNEQAATTQA
ncbi:MAG: aminoglycoside phosphotransferase family protein [Chloroflexia bacterium]